jgi:hypothetical protein
MGIFAQLENNKGTVSSALGKKLAQEVLNGDTSILNEAVYLSSYNKNDKRSKNIRSGAAKIVEIVAEQNPGLVAPYLEDLLPALSVYEPQTRWMAIRTIGFCAHLKESIASQAIPFAEKFIDSKDGLCLVSSADLFLGDMGATSKANAIKVFPILVKSTKHIILNEQDWLLEAFIKIFKNLERIEQDKIIAFANEWAESLRKSTVTRVKKLLKLNF